MNTEQRLEVAIRAMQEAYSNLKEVFGQVEMMDHRTPKAVYILQEALDIIIERSIT